MYVSTKTYGFDRGFAVAYRQWRADSHCNLLHGYALGFRFEFAVEDNGLDVRNWAVDFGSLGTLKDKLEEWFDHTTLVALDDPMFKEFERMHELKMCRMVAVQATGCEAIAKWLYDYIDEIWLPENGYAPRVSIHRVEVMEHSANSAWYQKSK